MSTTCQTTGRISETVSENARPRRGRPWRFDPQFIAELRSLYPEVRSARGLLNCAYRASAIAVLGTDRRFAWIWDQAAIEQGKANAWQPGVLAELGKLESGDEIREAATRVCNRKGVTRTEALAIVRAYRHEREIEKSQAAVRFLMATRSPAGLKEELTVTS